MTWHFSVLVFHFLVRAKFSSNTCVCSELVRRPLTNEPIGCMQHLFQSESDSCRSRAQTDEQQNRSRPCKTGKSSTIKVDHLNWLLAATCFVIHTSHFSLAWKRETRSLYGCIEFHRKSRAWNRFWGISICAGCICTTFLHRANAFQLNRGHSLFALLLYCEPISSFGAAIMLERTV